MSECQWEIYVQDMLECCTKITTHTSGLDRNSFFANDIVYEAVLWNIVLLGEAANKVPDDIQTSNNQIPWRAITGLRNRLIHGYSNISDDIVWEVIQQEIPALRPQLISILGLKNYDDA